MTRLLPRAAELMLFAATLAAGILIVAQLRSNERVTSTIESGESTTIALEVGELTRVNTKLRREVGKLAEERENLRQSLNDTRTATETLSTSLAEFEVLLGLRAVRGPGVRLTIRQQIDATQLLDLINAIKSVGVEAMSINGERVGARTAVSGTVFTPPLTVEVIGDRLLRDALIRKGGILEQLAIDAQVAAEEQLTIPARTSE